jgi:phosphoglycolate phosphatase-like HAD superfamily hydrolase
VLICDAAYDGEAARRAGVTFIAVLCGGWSEQELNGAGAVALYKDPEDLLLNWTRTSALAFS